VNLRRFYQVSAVVLALSFGIALWGLVVVGPDAQVPMHWNAAGEVDGYGSALVAFLITPLITVGVVALFAVIPRIEPRAEHLARSGRAYETLALSIVILLGGLQLILVLAGVGHPVDVALLMGAGTGVLFMIMGNVLGTIRSNFMVGVRTPWTLTSERSWAKTHRLVGRLFVLLGAILVVVSVLGAARAVFVVLLGGIGIILAVTVIYSYAVWRDDPDRQPGPGAAAR
jgi:uncharacterized membrane protein